LRLKLVPPRPISAELASLLLLEGVFAEASRICLMKELQNFSITWFDGVLLAAIVIGIFRGRKRGMSEELLDVFQWLSILIGCSYSYRPIGMFIEDFTHLGYNFCFVFSYLLVAILIKLLCTAVKRATGEKLVHADAFGSGEYYLGMMAGTIRWLSILIVMMSLLHAYYISPQDRARIAKLQSDNFGSISFPTIGSVQTTVFHESPSGNFIRKHLSAQLIQPVPPGARSETLGHWRERDVDDAMGAKGR
jgi:uncharacterized membrane protein required for colicin V production